MPVCPPDQGASVRSLVMPDFSSGTQAYTHSIHSVLATLAALGVPQSRISIQRSGREAVAAGTVVGQHPLPGELLRQDGLVTLLVAGTGFTHALPVGMWDSGGEVYAGTLEILSGLDDPLEKLKHWFHEGAPLFRIAPDDPAACARWLQLFGVEPEQWPRSLWFPLATLVARFAQLSCSQNGCALVLQTLLGLPVKSFRYAPSISSLPSNEVSSLGGRATRLGVDMVLGDRVEDLAKLVVEIGPVALPVYEQYVESKEGAALLRRTLQMVMPASVSYEVAWSVHDRSRPPQLGVAAANSRLGINTHMGSELAAMHPIYPMDTSNVGRRSAHEVGANA